MPHAVSTGAELELLAQPMEGLTLSGSVTYADARYPGDCVDFDPNAPSATSGLCGYPLTNSARWTGVLGFSWDALLPGSEVGYFISANYRYESDRRTSTQPLAGNGVLNPGDYEDDNGKADLRVGFVGPDELWAVEFWGSNIFDKQTKNVTFNVPLRGIGSVGTAARGSFLEEPRTYGVTVRFRY